MWQEWREGIGGGPPLETLERRWGPRLRPTKAQKVAFSRRKVVLDELLRLQLGGLSAREAVDRLEEIRDGRSVLNLVARLTAQRAARREAEKDG